MQRFTDIRALGNIPETLAKRSKGNVWETRTTHQVAVGWFVYNALAGTAVIFGSV